MHHGNKNDAMVHVKSVTIPQPCHETWQAMTPVTGGRHCMSCCKTVTDFTTMSNDEIITYLSSNHNVCGRFDNEQIAGINKHLQIHNVPAFRRVKGWALVLSLLSPLAFGTIHAQTRMPVVQTAIGSGSLCSGHTIGKIASMKTVSGYVTDEHGHPIPFAKIIFFQGETSGTMTDKTGSFSVQVLSGYSEFRVVAQGYLPQDVHIHSDTISYHVKLKDEGLLLGEVVRVKQSFFKYIYYRCISQPYRKVFK